MKPKRSTQIRQARKATAASKRLAFNLQRPVPPPRRQAARKQAADAPG